MTLNLNQFSLALRQRRKEAMNMPNTAPITVKWLLQAATCMLILPFLSGTAAAGVVRLVCDIESLATGKTAEMAYEFDAQAGLFQGHSDGDVQKTPTGSLTYHITREYIAVDLDEGNKFSTQTISRISGEYLWTFNREVKLKGRCAPRNENAF